MKKINAKNHYYLYKSKNRKNLASYIAALFIIMALFLPLTGCATSAKSSSLASPCVAKSQGFLEHDMEPCVRETPVLNSLYVIR